MKKFKLYMCDFETTVFEGIEKTEVWASACVELYTEDVHVFHSIGELFDYFINTEENIRCWFHNLKFDGSFILSYLMLDLELEQAYHYKHIEDGDTIVWDDMKQMRNNTFQYVISDMGQWYRIVIKINNHYIEIRDSLKLLPFSVKQIGKGFKTKHQKLDIEYEGFRFAGCYISPEEIEYIKNDVLVVAEALEQMFEKGLSKLTIGSCCLDEFKKITFGAVNTRGIDQEEYDKTFPDLTKIELNKNTFGSSNVDEYIRKSYKGGWCYVARGKENQVKYKGLTADVNSLYPSMMSAESGNAYPVGLPTFWQGNFIPEVAQQEHKYYFVRVKTRFKIKKDYLPFIQIKGTYFYSGHDCLETSDIQNPKDKQYYSEYVDYDGTTKRARVTLTLTQTDYALIREHYDLMEFQILDGCYFDSVVGVFDDYIDKYRKQKIEAKTATEKQIAKLMLNNLYGKLATSDDSSFKIAYVKDNNAIGFHSISANNKKTMYIPCGSAITSYARNFTIRAAQKNYHGVNARGFIYADTDSIHCDLEPEELVGVPIHDKNFCHWKLESYWDFGIFVRQKTYIEHITHEDGEEIENPYYNVKCAGMPERCKNLLTKSMNADFTDIEKYTPAEQDFIKVKRDITDFKQGLIVNGKLTPKRIEGGIVLVSDVYTMR